jgi:hypothetical protein
MENERSFFPALWANRVMIALAAIVVVLLVCLTASIVTAPGHGDSGLTSDSYFTTPGNGTLPPVTEMLGSATLTVTMPDRIDLVPYTERSFDEPEPAAIAWWMYPGYMANTSEYRGYLRASPETRANYSPDMRVFFDYITDSLDDAENASVLHDDIILYRGISGNYVFTVINNSRYSDNSYASTSYDPAVCLGGFGARTSDGYQNVLVMKTDEGDHALYINDEAREILIPRGTVWVVTRVMNVGNLTVQADFPLSGTTNMTAVYTNVRLIYLDEIG